MTEPRDSEPSDSESRLEELAAQGAEAYAEFSAYASSPDAPERARQIARRLAGLFADQAAWAARTEMSVAQAEQNTADLEAIMYGEDMAVLAAALRRRLSGEQVASLTARLDSGD